MNSKIIDWYFTYIYNYQLYYTINHESQYMEIVKLHRVFLSCELYKVSSLQFQFHCVYSRDSVEFVNPFILVYN